MNIAKLAGAARASVKAVTKVTALSTTYCFDYPCTVATGGANIGDWALPGRALHESNSNHGGDNESSAISNSHRARSNNHRRKRLHAPSSQASRSRADCSARSSGPEGHKIYGDLEGHDCKIGKAKA